MSPFSKGLLLDTDCVSRLFIARSLRKVLTLWPPGTFKVPQRVLDEARNWPAHGSEVCEIIDGLKVAGRVELVKIDDQSEEEMGAYINVRLRQPGLGKGESEAIAIASHRGYWVATDDALARERCNSTYPNVRVITTARILKEAEADGFLTRAEVDEIWRRIRLSQERVRGRTQDLQ